MSKRTVALESANSFLHVCNRGVGQSTIFFNDNHYEVFMDLLRTSQDPSEIELNAFTLMPNHFHLILHQFVPRAVSQYMTVVCGTFARFINATRHRSGHLFESRHRPVVLCDPTAVLQMSCYVHKNPVRAKLVEVPEAWRYGSMCDYAGLRSSGIVSPDRILNLVGGRENYLRFLKEYDPKHPNSVARFLV